MWIIAYTKFSLLNIYNSVLVVDEVKHDDNAASESDNDPIDFSVGIHAGGVLVFDFFEYLLSLEVPDDDTAALLVATGVAPMVRSDNVLHVADLQMAEHELLGVLLVEFATHVVLKLHFTHKTVTRTLKR